MERRGSLPGWQPSLHGSNTAVVAGSWTSELIFWNHKVIKVESSIPDLSPLQLQYFQDFNSQRNKFSVYSKWEGVESSLVRRQ